jgi:hypothetical protein
MAVLTGARGPLAAWMRRGWRCLVVAAAVSLLLAARPGESGEQEDEYAVKAAFLYNFVPFVEWPATSFDSPDAPFVVCVSGRDPFGVVLDRTLARKTVGGHPFATRRLEKGEAAEGCHVLFVPGSEEPRAGAIVDSSRRASILTVGDFFAFADEGGVIAFYLEGNRVRFAINVDSAARSNLKISAHLLALARVVRNAPGS